VPANRVLSAGGSSQGDGGVSGTRFGDDGFDGLIVRSTVTDPIGLFSLSKQLTP